MNHDELVAYLDKLNELMHLSGMCQGVRIEYEPKRLKIGIGSEWVQHEVASASDLPAVRSMLASELHDEIAKTLQGQKANVRDSLERERGDQKRSLDKITDYEKIARNVVRSSKILATIKKPLIPGAPKEIKAKK